MKNHPALALVTALIYTGVNVVGASAEERSLWRERRRAVPHSTLLAMGPRSLVPAVLGEAVLLRSGPRGALPKALSRHSALASLPLEALTLRGAHWGRAGSPLVLHLQDVHQNAQAQKNLSLIAGSLIKEGSVDLIALEGAFAPIDLAPLREFPDRDALRQSADYLLKKNKISGPVHAALMAEKSVPLLAGIDDPLHYNANVFAYQQAAAVVEPVRAGLAAERRVLEGEKQATFSEDLRALDRIVEGYHDGTVPLGDYIRALARSGTPPPVPVRRFLEALALENTLDFPRVEKERGQLLENLTPRLSLDESRRLMDDTLAYRSGALGYGAFHEQLRALCESKGLSLSATLKDYVRYSILAQSINAEALHAGLPNFEGASLGALARTRKERILVDKAHGLRLKNKLTRFALTPSEWSDYRARSFREPGLTAFENFYREAETRDRAMAERLTNQMARSKARVVVLVTGGFHAAGVDRRLAAAGYSIVRASPRIDQADKENGSAALAVFTREKTPLQKMFAGEKLTLAPNPTEGLREAPVLAAAVAVKKGMASAAAAGAAQRAYGGAVQSVQLKWEKTKERVRVRLARRLREGPRSRAVVVTVNFRGVDLSTVTSEPDWGVAFRELPYTLWALVDGAFAEIFADQHGARRDLAWETRLMGLRQFIPLWTLGGIGLAFAFLAPAVGLAGPVSSLGALVAVLGLGTFGGLAGHVAGHVAFNKMFPWARLSLPGGTDEDAARVYAGLLTRALIDIKKEDPSRRRRDAVAWFGETLALPSNQQESAARLEELLNGSLRAQWNENDRETVAEIVAAYARHPLYQTRAAEILEKAAPQFPVQERWKLHRLLVRALSEPETKSLNFVERIMALELELQNQADPQKMNTDAGEIIAALQGDAKALAAMERLAQAVRNSQAKASAHLALARASAAVEEWAKAERALRQSRNHQLAESAADRSLLVRIVLNSKNQADLIDWIAADSPAQFVPRMAALGRALLEIGGNAAAVPVYQRAWRLVPPDQNHFASPTVSTAEDLAKRAFRSALGEVRANRNDRGSLVPIYTLVEELARFGLFSEASGLLALLKDQDDSSVDSLSELAVEQALIQGNHHQISDFTGLMTRFDAGWALRIAATVGEKALGMHLEYFLAEFGINISEASFLPLSPGDSFSPGEAASRRVDLARVMAAGGGAPEKIGPLLVAAAGDELFGTSLENALDLLLSHKVLRPYVVPFVEAQERVIHPIRATSSRRVLLAALRRANPNLVNLRLPVPIPNVADLFPTGSLTPTEASGRPRLTVIPGFGQSLRGALNNLFDEDPLSLINLAGGYFEDIFESLFLDSRSLPPIDPGSFLGIPPSNSIPSPSGQPNRTELSNELAERAKHFGDFLNFLGWAQAYTRFLEDLKNPKATYMIDGKPYRLGLMVVETVGTLPFARALVNRETQYIDIWYAPNSYSELANVFFQSVILPQLGIPKGEMRRLGALLAETAANDPSTDSTRREWPFPDRLRREMAMFVDSPENLGDCLERLSDLRGTFRRQSELALVAERLLKSAEAVLEMEVARQQARARRRALDAAVVRRASTEWGPITEVRLDYLKENGHPDSVYDGLVGALREGRVLVLRPGPNSPPESPPTRMTTLSDVAAGVASALARAGWVASSGEGRTALTALFQLAYIEGNEADPEVPIALGISPEGLIKVWDAGAVNDSEGVLREVERQLPTVRKTLDAHMINLLNNRDSGSSGAVMLPGQEGRHRFYRLGVRLSEITSLASHMVKNIPTTSRFEFVVNGPEDLNRVRWALGNNVIPFIGVKVTLLHWLRGQGDGPLNGLNDVVSTLIDFVGGDPAGELQSLFDTLSSRGLLRQPFFVLFDRAEGQRRVVLYALPFPGQTAILGDGPILGQIHEAQSTPRVEGKKAFKVVRPVLGKDRARETTTAGSPNEPRRGPRAVLGVASTALSPIPIRGERYEISHLREAPEAPPIGFELVLRPRRNGPPSSPPGKKGPVNSVGMKRAAQQTAETFRRWKEGGTVSAKDLSAILAEVDPDLGLAGRSLLNRWAVSTENPAFAEAVGREFSSRSLSPTWSETVSFLAESIWGLRPLDALSPTVASGDRPLDVILVDATTASRFPNLLRRALAGNRTGTVVLSGLDAAGRQAIADADRNAQCLTVPPGPWLSALGRTPRVLLAGLERDLDGRLQLSQAGYSSCRLLAPSTLALETDNLQTDLFRRTAIVLLTRLGFVAVPLAELHNLFQTARAIASAA